MAKLFVIFQKNSPCPSIKHSHVSKWLLASAMKTKYFCERNWRSDFIRVDFFFVLFFVLSCRQTEVFVKLHQCPPYLWFTNYTRFIWWNPNKYEKLKSQIYQPFSVWMVKCCPTNITISKSFWFNFKNLYTSKIR